MEKTTTTKAIWLSILPAFFAAKAFYAGEMQS